MREKKEQNRTGKETKTGVMAVTSPQLKRLQYRLRAMMIDPIAERMMHEMNNRSEESTEDATAKTGRR